MESDPVTMGKAEFVFEVTQNTIYLMGASFVLGSLFTVLLLLMLDFVRRDQDKETPEA